MSETDLGDRYGTASPQRRRALIVVAAAVVLAFGLWLGWTILEQSRPAVASGELRFEIVDANTAEATFEVHLRDDDVDATCRLRAFAEDKTLVGEVAFAPEPDAAGEVTREIATDRRATAVELVGCTAPGQSRPR